MASDGLIRSIIPAPRWSAVFQQRDGTAVQKPLVGFALVDEAEGPRVTGLVADWTRVELVANVAGFLCYHEGDTPHPATAMFPVKAEEL
jgi:hypothetical protein